MTTVCSSGLLPPYASFLHPAPMDGVWLFDASRILTGVTALFLLPWTLFVALNGGLVEYFEAGLDYSRGEAAATALTAWPRMVFNSSRASTTNAEAWLFWLFWSLPLVCGVIAWRHARKQRERWSGELSIVAALVVVGVLVNASFIRQALQVRLPDAIVPAALLAAWALGACWTGPWRRRGYQWAVRVATDCLHRGVRDGGQPRFHDWRSSTTTRRSVKG